MALLPTANSYTVAFFSGKNCNPDTRTGVQCGGIDQVTCCQGLEGDLYVSVGDDASWGYSMQDGDPCGIVLGSGEGCYSADNGIEVITGGSVVGLVDRAEGQRSEPPKVAKVDSWFYRNGTEKYTLPIDSDDGRFFRSLEDQGAQVDFITSHGQFTRLEE